MRYDNALAITSPGMSTQRPPRSGASSIVADGAKCHLIGSFAAEGQRATLLQFCVCLMMRYIQLQMLQILDSCSGIHWTCLCFSQISFHGSLFGIEQFDEHGAMSINGRRAACPIPFISDGRSQYAPKTAAGIDTMVITEIRDAEAHPLAYTRW